MNPFNLKILDLTGSPREIGQAHGEACRETIQIVAQAQQDYVSKNHNLALQEHRDLIFEKTQFYKAACRWVPDVVAEVEGLSQGANLNFQDMFIYQMLDENGWVIKKVKGKEDFRENDECSAIGAYGKAANPPILAQNADMGKSVDGYQMLIHHHNTTTSMRTFFLTLPGIVGIYGMNDHSIAITLNAMSGRMHKSILGLGTVYIARGLLCQKSFYDAVQFLQAVPHASGETYSIGSTDQVACYEGSPHNLSRYIPFRGAEVIYHTNHAILNQDIELTPGILSKESTEFQNRFQLGMQNSIARFKSLECHLKNKETQLTVDEAVKILSAEDDPENPVCRHKLENKEAMTNFSIIYRLAPSPEVFVAGGPPCMSEFKKFTFDDFS